MQMFFRCFLFGFCVGFSSLRAEVAVNATPESFRLIFEAEEFDGLPFYGNWYSKEGIGWYTKEHGHALGRAVAVCDELSTNAEMIKRFEKPIPAGEFKIFLRVVMMRMGFGNTIKLEFGNWKDKAFERAEEIYIQWRLGTGYGWLSQGVDLKVPCTHLRVTATKVECQGIGDVPEDPKAKIILDQFIITNEVMARLEPDPKLRGRYLVVLPGDEADTKTQERAVPEAVSLSHTSFRAHTKDRSDDSILDIPELEVPTSSTNLVPNGSFEYSLRPNWRAMVNFFHGYDLNSENLDPDFPSHGHYCLKLPFTDTNYLSPPERMLYGMSIEAAPFPVKPATTYWVSFTGRASQNDLKVSSRLGRFDLSLRWKKFQTRITTGDKQETFSLNFIARSKDPEQVVWLDEVEMREVTDLSKKEVPPAKFDARGQFEIGLRSEELGEVYYDGRPIQFVLVANNTRLSGVKDVAEIRVIDTDGRMISRQTQELDIPPYDVVEKRLTFEFRRMGAFLAVYWLKNSPHPVGRLAFSVVPEPKSKIGKRPFIGIYSQSVGSAMKLGARLGFDWVTPLSDRIFSARYIAQKNKPYDFYDSLLSQWKEHGFDFVGETLPSEKPAWDRGMLGTQPAAGASTAFFKEAVWRQHLQNMFAHYKGLKHWILADEAELLRTPDDFTPYVNVANEVARQLGPDAKIMYSAGADMMEAVFKKLGTQKVQDIFAGTKFLAGKWAYTRDREFCNKYGMRAWNLGVGYPTSWMYDLVSENGKVNYPAIEELQRQLNQEAFDLMLQSALIEPDRFCHYNGKLEGGEDPYSIYAADNSFRPGAVQFVNVLQHLRGVHFGALLEFATASFIDGCYFVRDEWTYAALNNSGAAGDHRLVCRTQSNAVTVLDRNFNPVKFEQLRDGIVFDLPVNELRILRDITGRRAQFLESVRLIESTPYLVARPLLLPSDDKSTKVGISLTGFPTSLAAGEFEFSANGQTAKLSVSQTPKMFVFDMQLPANRPITNFPLPYQMKSKTGRTYSDTLKMWVISAPTVNSEAVWLDGELTEWEGRTPIFLYASQATDGSYGTQQARFGGHAIQSLADSSARVWCRWSTQGLFLAADVIDDNLRFAPADPEPGKPGDQLQFLIDTNLLGDLHVSGADDDDYKIVFGPGAIEDPRAKIYNAKGDVQILETRFKTRADGYILELFVPWSFLGRAWPNLITNRNWVNSLGFDVILRDADGTTLLKSELAWAGHNGANEDPTAYGQLVLLPGYKDALVALVRSFDKGALTNIREEYLPAEELKLKESKKKEQPKLEAPPKPVIKAPDNPQPITLEGEIEEGGAREISRTARGLQLAPPASVREQKDQVETEETKKKGFFRRIFSRKDREKSEEEGK